MFVYLHSCLRSSVFCCFLKVQFDPFKLRSFNYQNQKQHCQIFGTHHQDFMDLFSPFCFCVCVCVDLTCCVIKSSSSFSGFIVPMTGTLVTAPFIKTKTNYRPKNQRIKILKPL